jgi:outer membrane protein assembly factor BamE (lipoprotein component of BamABCDE complex)
MPLYGCALIAIALLIGCSSTQTGPALEESNLTAGMAKLKILKDKTTQAEVLEIFGPPDMVTHRDDLRIWTYNKVRYDIRETAGGLFVIGAVAGGSGGGAGAAGGSGSRRTSSSKMTILTIHFDSQDIVRDYRMQVTRF